MPETRLGAARLASIAGLSALSLGIGLGSSGRLTYHEAFVAQAAREMIASGSVLVPTIDGQPWLEKPPLAFWLVAVAGRMAGEVTEFAARAPSAVAATLLALGLAAFASRRFGPTVGWLAGLIQVTTLWTILRGRLAEADILLACLVTATMVAFDRLRMAEPAGRRPGAASRRSPVARAGPALPPLSPGEGPRASRRSRSRILPPPRERAGVRVERSAARSEGRSRRDPHPGPLPEGEGRSAPWPGTRGHAALRLDPPPGAPPSPSWRWAFFATLGASALVKGLGFGAVLAGSAIAAVLLWDRDRSAIRALRDPRGWALAGVLALTWPVLVAIRLPAAVSLWTLHVTDRLASRPEHFIGGPWWQYGPAVLLQALPWTPLALIGAWPSLLRAIARRGGGDRLLWAWAVVPVLVLSTATVKNAHYAIHALPPLSVWAAMGLIRVGSRLRSPGVVGVPGPPGGRGPVPGPRPGVGPGSPGPRPPVRPPRGRVGLLRADRPGARPVDPPGLPLRGLGPQALPDALRPGPPRLGHPPLLPEAARLLATGARRPRRPAARARPLCPPGPRPRPPRPPPARPGRDPDARARRPVRPDLHPLPDHPGP